MGPKKKRDQLSSVDSPTTAKNVGHTSQKGEKTGDVKKQNRSTAKSRPSPKASSVEKSKGTKPRGGHESQKRQPNSPNRQYSDDAGPSMTGKKQAENESGSKKQLRPIDKSQTIHDDMPNGSDSGTNSKRRARIHDRHNQKQKFLQKMHQSQTSQAIFRQSGTRPKLTQSIPPQRVTGTVVDNRGNGDEDYSDEEEEEVMKKRHYLQRVCHIL